MPPNCTRAVRLPAHSSMERIFPGTARHMGRLLMLVAVMVAVLVAFVEAVAFRDLPHQAALAKVDAALQAEFVAAAAVHDAGRQTVEQVGGAAQILFGDAAENPL